MKLEELKLNKYELYDFKDVWEYFWLNEYGKFYMWLQIIHRKDNKQMCPFGIDPVLFKEYIDQLDKLKD